MTDKTIEQEVSELIDTVIQSKMPNILYLKSMMHGYIRLARMEGQNIQLQKQLEPVKEKSPTPISDSIFEDLANYFKPIK